MNMLQAPGMVENFVPLREKHAAPTIPIGADLDVQYTLQITMLSVHGIIIPMEGYIDQGTAQIRSFSTVVLDSDPLRFTQRPHS